MSREEFELRLRNILGELEDLRIEVGDNYPERSVTWYLDGSENLCLMVYKSQGQFRQEDIFLKGKFRFAEGGDW